MTTQQAFWSKVTGGNAGATVELLGEVVTWTIHGDTTLSRVRAALAAAGLDPKVAHAFKARNAFARACRSLEKARIIRRLFENPAEARFQFTREDKETVAVADPVATGSGTPAVGASLDETTSARYAYAFETILSLRKATGEIVCPNEALAAEARELLAKHIERRTANDVLEVVKSLFKAKAKSSSEADLWPIRAEGGVYFVMASQDAFMSQIAQFLAAVGGVVGRLPIPAGTANGNQTVHEVVSRGIGGLVRDLEARIEQFDDATKQNTVHRLAGEIRQMKEKLDAYAAYMGETRESILSRVVELQERLRAKIIATPVVPTPAAAPSPAADPAGVPADERADERAGEPVAELAVA